MRLINILVAGAALGATAVANAETRLIEGYGAAKNAAGLMAQFQVRTIQVNNNAASGRLTFVIKRSDSTATIVCERPRYVAITEHQGRFEGPAKVTVKNATGERTWEGNVFFTGWDLKPAVANKADKVRVRFIRNPFESPEGDFFYEGEVTDGQLVVRKS